MTIEPLAEPVLFKRRIAASIEISPQQALEITELPSLFPPETSVYITDILPIEASTLVRAARQVRDVGYKPVPHIAARRLTTRTELQNRLAAMSGEAGVSDVLLIGGGPERPAGEFDSTLAVLETGLLHQYHISRIAVAGHPEGSPDFSEEGGIRTLKLKQAFAQRTDAEMRIVTQFGFDATKIVQWAEGLGAHGVDLPVHVGVSGPAKLGTLIKYAASCGIGNSIDFLKKQAGKLTTLATGFSPETVVEPIEKHWQTHDEGAIRQIHVFAFGGLKQASSWLRERGSWP